MTESLLQDDGHCFGCGPRNAIGLGLNFAWDHDVYYTRWTPSELHQGWAGRVHGGLLALVLDETLSRAALDRSGRHWVTAELTVRLKEPAPIGQPLRIEARLVSVRPSLIVCEGAILREDGGSLVASGQAKMMRAVSPGNRQEQTMPEPTYVTQSETPLEAAARAEVERDAEAVQNRREEQEADTLMADIDTYVARTDPASLPDAERALNEWEIPGDPLAGIPGDVALAPGVEGEPFVSVFAAQSESEANIVRGLIEASGIPVTFDGLPAPILGSVFQAGEARWGDLLVPASQAEQARAVIVAATAPSDPASNSDSASD